MDGKTARGASSPAKPALHIPDPLSITRAATSSSHILRLGVYNTGWPADERLLIPSVRREWGRSAAGVVYIRGVGRPNHSLFATRTRQACALARRPGCVSETDFISTSNQWRNPISDRARIFFKLGQFADALFPFQPLAFLEAFEYDNDAGEDSTKRQSIPSWSGNRAVLVVKIWYVLPHWSLHTILGRR